MPEYHKEANKNKHTAKRTNWDQSPPEIQRCNKQKKQMEAEAESAAGGIGQHIMNHHTRMGADLCGEGRPTKAATHYVLAYATNSFVQLLAPIRSLRFCPDQCF